MAVGDDIHVIIMVQWNITHKNSIRNLIRNIYVVFICIKNVFLLIKNEIDKQHVVKKHSHLKSCYVWCRTSGELTGYL